MATAEPYFRHSLRVNDYLCKGCTTCMRSCPTGAIRIRNGKAVVADEGPGIPNLDLAMQEGWSTASPQVREMGYGAGMGLPNIKKNTDDLKIDTKVGVGTTVTMTVNLV